MGGRGFDYGHGRMTCEGRIIMNSTSIRQPLITRCKYSVREHISVLTF